MNWLVLASIGAFGAAACAVAFVARLLAAPVETGGTLHRRPARPPAWWRLGAPWVRVLGPPLDRALPRAWRQSLQSALGAAGLDASLSPGAFVAGQILAAASLALLAWAARRLAALAGPVEAASQAASTLAQSICILLGALALGALLPRLWLRDQAIERRRRLLRQLPSLLDLLTVALEAGQSPSSALSLACDRLPAGPLQAEIDRVLRDVRAGRGSADALQAMAARLRIPAVAHMVSALVVGARQGSNLGPLLRAQAAQRRQERFVRAERAALQAPVKLLLPLATCIFPGTFAILFFPVAVRLLAQGVL